MVYNNGMEKTKGKRCRKCGSENIVRNGVKSNKLRNYRCKGCGRQFIAESGRAYRGTSVGIDGYKARSGEGMRHS
jgi:transposase-like protein